MKTCLNCGNPLKRAAQKFCCAECRSQHHYKPDILLITAVKRFLTAHNGDVSVMLPVIDEAVHEWGDKHKEFALRLWGLGADVNRYVQNLREGEVTDDKKKI